jgi:hypothetical protein
VAVNLVRFIVAAGALLICAAAPAAELHPIVAVEFGYFFGATANGKWIKAEDAAKSIPDETSYRIYGLTQALGGAKGDKPKPADGPCEETLAVSLSPETEKGVIAIAAPWNALPRKPQVTDPTQKTYVDAVREFLRTKEIDQPKVKIDNIVRVDLDGDGEEEVLISGTNYFRKDESVPMRSLAASYSMVLLRRVVAGKVETQLIVGEFYQGLSEGRTRRGALQRAERLQSDRDAGFGWRRQNGSRGRLALLRRRRDNDLPVRSKKSGAFTFSRLRRVNAESVILRTFGVDC